MIASAAAREKRGPSVALLVLSAAMTGLAIFQWIELVLVRRGGSAVCTVNETINCETVWNSILAEKMHALFRVPVAALGLVWGLTALVHAVRLWVRLSHDRPSRPVVPALRVIALVGVLACVGFACASAQAHALCLTCLGTYLLVLGFAGVAFFALPKPLAIARDELVPALLWPAAISVGAYLLLLLPLFATPRKSAPLSDSLPQNQSVMLPGSSDADLVAYLGTLSPEEKTAIGIGLADYRSAKPPMAALAFSPRPVVGDPHAVVHVLDFTDIKCPHCRHLEEGLKAMRSTLPPGRLAVESRFYPLDQECNPHVEAGLGKNVRCVGAKAQLCLSHAPDFAELQDKLFAEQDTLTADRAIEIAASGSVGRDALLACMASAATAQELTKDIQLATIYGIEGTPLVVINGRSAGSAPAAFIYVLALASGDANAAALLSLSQTPAPAP